MVLNLCLPHFHTSVHCNKLCADGYDVTNLVSADPAVRRQGFKVEYFLRPPVQVTLKFGFQVDVCRVDVEMWPWGMDHGQACKRLEISTSSDRLPSKDFDHKQQQQQEKKQVTGNNRQIGKKQHGSISQQSNGHQWSLQAHQWGKQTSDEPQQRKLEFKCRPNTESSHPDVEFKLVGRCELKEETRVCFTRYKYRHRPPFLSSPPPQPAGCRQEGLWSRGLLSLGAVTQLRVTVPYGGAASALGLKALVVWGQPAHCCPAEEVERIKGIHETSERRTPRPRLFAPAVSQKAAPSQAAKSPSNLSIPEEFLDPITQEVMMLPMLLPSGVSVDNSTLEEHQKREATWGRPPNDPFTGVPFTSTSQPLPNPQLKSRIDLFLLQKGMMGRDGMLGRHGEGENPQASRLVASTLDKKSQDISYYSESSVNKTVHNEGTRNTKTESGGPSDIIYHTSMSQPLTKDSKSEIENRKRDLEGISEDSIEDQPAEKQILLQRKRQRNETEPVSSCSSHEQRLSASLDEALFSALQGRPSFTSNLSQQKQDTPGSGPLSTSLQTVGTPSMAKGKQTCSACSCLLSVYSKSSSLPIYRLTCGHLLCGSCLRRKSQPLNSVTGSTANHVSCPSCKRPSPRSDIIRVHH